MNLGGDGTSTSHCQLLLIDKGTGETIAARLNTYCISKKSIKPPPSSGDGQKAHVNYHLGPVAPATITDLVKTSRKLDAEHNFDALPIPSTRRASTIAQLAIWKSLGGTSKSSKDAVNTDSIKADLLSRSNTDPASLSKEEHKQLDDKVALIFDAVDLTCKTSTTQEDRQTIKEPEIPLTELPHGPLPEKENQNRVIPYIPVTLINESHTYSRTVLIPRYITFVSDNPTYQTMMYDDGGDGDGTEVPRTTDRNDVIPVGMPPDGGTTTDGGNPAGGTTTGGNTTPGDGGTIVKDPHTPGPKTKEKEKNRQLGICLFRDKIWIPHSPDTTKATARIYELDEATKNWSPSTIPVTIKFKFAKRSNETGDCLNNGTQTTPDLFIPANSNPELKCSDSEGGAGYFGAAETNGPVTEKTIIIKCEDFGAFSTLQATADRCCQLKEAADGKIVGPVNLEESQVTIPKDEDKVNQIADAYEDILKRHPSADEDEDSIPTGNGKKGDGFSAYEEYRGFYSMGKHIRTDWNSKDLFIHDQDSMGFGKFPETSLISCWPIKKTEYSGNDDRVVNFNRGHATLGQQHGLWLADENESEGIDGRSHGIGPPKNVSKVTVNKTGALTKTLKRPKMVNGKTVWKNHVQEEETFQVVIQPSFDDTVTHELGHATGLHHHGESIWADASSSTINPAGTLSWKTSNKAKLCGCTLPGTFLIGRKQNRSSGDEDCYMRYSNLVTPVVYEFGGDYECLMTDTKPKTIFCTTKNAHSFNAGGHMAGDAEIGNCQSQFVVNDR